MEFFLYLYNNTRDGLIIGIHIYFSPKWRSGGKWETQTRVRERSFVARRQSLIILIVSNWACCAEMNENENENEITSVGACNVVVHLGTFRHRDSVDELRTCCVCLPTSTSNLRFVLRLQFVSGRWWFADWNWLIVVNWRRERERRRKKMYEKKIKIICESCKRAIELLYWDLLVSRAIERAIWAQRKRHTRYRSYLSCSDHSTHIS